MPKKKIIKILISILALPSLRGVALRAELVYYNLLTNLSSINKLSYASISI